LQGEIDRDWPYQVALPAERCTDKNGEIYRAFCRSLGLSLGKRHHSFRRFDRQFQVFCFAEKEDALMFLMHFGGETIDQKLRRKRR
jgi:hypothetical protein